MKNITLVTCNFGSYDDQIINENTILFSEDNDPEKEKIEKLIDDKQIQNISFIKSRYYKFFGTVDETKYVIYHDSNILIKKQQLLQNLFNNNESDFIFIYHPYFKLRLFEMIDCWFCGKATLDVLWNNLKNPDIKKFSRVNQNSVFLRRSNNSIREKELNEFFCLLSSVTRDQWFMPEFLKKCGYNVKTINGWHSLADAIEIKQHKFFFNRHTIKRAFSKILRVLPFI
jgi:hypothetical protein